MCVVPGVQSWCWIGENVPREVSWCRKCENIPGEQSKCRLSRETTVTDFITELLWTSSLSFPVKSEGIPISHLSLVSPHIQNHVHDSYQRVILCSTHEYLLVTVVTNTTSRDLKLKGIKFTSQMMILLRKKINFASRKNNSES